MKNILLATLLFANLIFAQKSNSSDIEITAFVDSNNNNIPAEAQQIALNALTNVIIKNGVSKGINSDFILTANTIILEKVIVPTAPSQVALDLSVNLYIGNIKDGNLYESTQVTLKGIGQNETKAYIDAIKKLNQNNKTLENLVVKAKSKIIQYYTQKCDIIIAEANKLEKTENFEGALYKLMSIPQECTNCYSKASLKSEIVYKKAIDFDAKVKLNQARQTWNANPNESGAKEATEILMQINPNASNFKEVKILGSEISKKLNENDKRNWQLYYEKEVGLEKDYINAAKEIGKAYGAGQPKQVYNNIKWW